nr:immunoglobulin heavy chain junction region [Mus musculus]
CARYDYEGTMDYW